MTETNKPVYHASSLPSFFCCPAMAHLPSTKIDFRNHAAEIGTATHDAVRLLCMGGDIDQIIQGLQGFTDAELSEIAYMAKVGHKWQKEFVPADEYEINYEVTRKAEFPLFKTKCRIDLEAVKTGKTILADWKTTRKSDADYSAQMADCAAAHLDNHPDEDSVLTATVFLRDSTVCWVEHTRGSEEMEDFFRNVNRLTRWDGKTYCIGDHCQYCKDVNCPAFRDVLQDAVVTALLDPAKYEKTVEGCGVPDPAIVDAYSSLSALKGRALKHLETIKLLVLRFGSISGKEFYLAVKEEKRKSIDALKAWEILSEELTQEELAGATKIAMGAVKGAIKDKTIKGKGKAVMAFMDRLESAGALNVKTIKSVKKIKNKEES